MDVPDSVMGLAAVRLGIGLAALAVPSSFALGFGRPLAEARTPMALVGSGFFGVRELTLVGLTATASVAEPKALKRLLYACAATDGLDFAVLAIRAMRRPGLRRAVLLLAPGAAVSVFLHIRAAQKIEVES